MSVQTKNEKYIRNLGAKLREARLQAGLTKLDVEKDTGIYSGDISNFEAGILKLFQIDDLLKLSNLYDVYLDWFFWDEV